MGRDLKNIIIVYDCANVNGGAAKVAIQSAIALSNEEYNVYYFAATGPIDSNLQNSNVKVVCLGINDINHGSRFAAIKNGIWNNTVKRKFGDFLNDFSCDETLIHIHGWVKALSSAVVKEANSRGFKTIITLHDYFSLCPNGGFYDYQKQEICDKKPMSFKCIKCNCDKRNYAQKLWRVMRQRVQDRYIRNNPNLAFISISQKNESLVKPFVRSSYFFRVNNPVQLSMSKNEDCEKSNIFLYVGRLSEEKGIDLFCQAITELKINYDIEGVVVGDGVLFKHMELNYPSVQFVGWKNINEVHSYIRNSRSLILSSKCFEGAPLTIIEAMSAGVPCIVSDCTSAIELIEDGNNGYIFEHGNVDSLKLKILHTFDANYRMVVKNVQIGDYKSYSADAHVMKLRSAYLEWLNQD